MARQILVGATIALAVVVAILVDVITMAVVGIILYLDFNIKCMSNDESK